jgi:hypothetical protein
MHLAHGHGKSVACFPSTSDAGQDSARQGVTRFNAPVLPGAAPLKAVRYIKLLA